MTKEDLEKLEAIKKLKKLVKPGDTVYTILRHVSRSGMSREISLVLKKKDCIFDISFYAAAAMGDRINRKSGGIKIGGCGMDMGFSLVYSLGWALWPKGFKTWAGYWRNEPVTFETDGGYALKQQWL